MAGRDKSESLDATADEDYRDLHAGSWKDRNQEDLDLEDDAELAAAATAEDDEDFMTTQIPTNLKTLRACLRCYLIKSFDQFFEEGCENCDFLEMRDDKKRVLDVTTAFFEGTIALLEPEKSWVAKWQRFQQNLPGLYAIEVADSLPQEDIERCKQAGFTYRMMSDKK